MHVRGWIGRSALLASVVLAVGTAGPAAAGEGAWAERVQVLYLREGNTVARQRLRVWDPHPDKNLEFTWEPAGGDGGRLASEGGLVEGRGKLVWRVRGSASYDPATIYSVYEGEMRAGRPHGTGRLEIRTGAVFEGEWRAGVLHGRGLHLDAEGNRYEGLFADGRPHGEGRYLAANGTIYEGPFVDGRRHGTGVTTLAGGTRYESRWQAGREVGPRGAEVLADPLVGGLLKAQTGGDADRVEFSVIVDPRMTQRSDMQYTHYVREEDVAIFPQETAFNDAWNGTGTITAFGGLFDFIDWEDAPAFVEVELATTDGSRVELDQMELQVARSDAYRKPMLSIRQHFGCVGFRPSFSFVNNGWGDVRDATLSLAFTNPDRRGVSTRAFSHPIGSFGDGGDVSLLEVFRAAGVDTETLETERFECPSVDSLGVCRNQVFNRVDFGEVADAVAGDQTLTTRAEGTIDYAWADDEGNVFQMQEPFSVDISLAVIEVPQELAECGAGFGGSPEALRYLDIELPVGERDYTVDLPVRGNRNQPAFTSRLKLSSAMSSVHRFRAAARLGDGSMRYSKPVTLFFLRPKASEFVSTMRPAQCYLEPGLGAC